MQGTSRGGQGERPNAPRMMQHSPEKREALHLLALLSTAAPSELTQRRGLRSLAQQAPAEANAFPASDLQPGAYLGFLVRIATKPCHKPIQGGNNLPFFILVTQCHGTTLARRQAAACSHRVRLAAAAAAGLALLHRTLHRRRRRLVVSRRVHAATRHVRHQRVRADTEGRLRACGTLHT